MPDNAAPRATDPLEVIDLGRLAYADALAMQRQAHGRVVAGDAGPTLMLVEHDPVITVSRRRGAGRNLLASPDRLAAMGIDVQFTDRGGDVTYHGPGQLVAYPIVRLSDYALNVGRYMRLLEQVIIDTAAAFDVDAGRVEGCTGVWVDPAACGFAQPSAHQFAKPQAAGAKPQAAGAKLAALGVRVSRNVTMHGLALNVTTDLTHFDTIVPCGLPNRHVTSLHELLGDAAPTMAQVKAALTTALRARLVSCLAAARRAGRRTADVDQTRAGTLEP